MSSSNPNDHAHDMATQRDEPNTTQPQKTIAYHETFDDPTSTASEYFSTNEVMHLAKLNDGGFSIGSIIGKGGMGVVHEAYQKLPSRTVAVKKLSSPNRRLSSVLMNEAMIMGSLEHPNIVPVHIVRIPEVYSPEVIMKRVDGQSLMDTLNGLPVQGDALRRVLEILKQVCLALEYAHAQNVVHRDVKPENIMTGSFGEVYLLDWGIAVRLDRLDQMPTGMVGTPSYMAPEMLSGFPKDVTPLTDVFLMGATLHEVLTGEARHAANTTLGALSQASRCPPYDYPPDVPVELARLANEACAQKPKDRLQSIADFRSRIEHILERWDAELIAELAREKLKHLKLLIDSSQGQVEWATKIRQAFSEARIGFEQVLYIDEDNTKATDGLQQTIVAMVCWLLDVEHLEEAQLLMATAPMEDDELSTRLRKAKDVDDRHRSEEAALRTLLSEFDRSPSRKARKAFAIVFSLMVFGTTVFALIYDHFQPHPITPERLLYTTSTTTVVTLLVTLFWRKSLLANRVGLRLIRSVVFGLVIAVCFTIGAIRLDLPANAVLLADIFIASLAMANTYPVIGYATTAALAIFTVGLVCVFFPALSQPGLMIVMAIVSGCLIRDWVQQDTNHDQ